MHEVELSGLKTCESKKVKTEITGVWWSKRDVSQQRRLKAKILSLSMPLYNEPAARPHQQYAASNGM